MATVGPFLVFFFCNYINIFHKTEVQTVILVCLTSQNLFWFKSYDTQSCKIWSYSCQKWPEMVLEWPFIILFHFRTVYTYYTLNQDWEFHLKCWGKTTNFDCFVLYLAFCLFFRWFNHHILSLLFHHCSQRSGMEL